MLENNKNKLLSNTKNTSQKDKIIKQISDISQEILSYNLCPNCDENSFLDWYWCKNCYYQVSEQHFFQYQKESSKKDEIIDTKKYKKISYFKSWINIYKILEKNWKIESIKIEISWRKYEIFIDYSFVKNSKTIIDFFHTDEDYVLNQVDIKWLKINSIYQKLNSWSKMVFVDNNLFIKILNFLNNFLKNHHL